MVEIQVNYLWQTIFLQIALYSKQICTSEYKKRNSNTPLILNYTKFWSQFKQKQVDFNMVPERFHFLLAKDIVGMQIFWFPIRFGLSLSKNKKDFHLLISSWRILLAACQRFAMVRISDNGKHLLLVIILSFYQKQFIIIINIIRFLVC